jgi:two-component system NtrC family sensor kinase
LEDQDLAGQLREANKRLQRQLQELNTVYTIGRAVTSLLDLNRVLGRVVEAAVHTVGAEEGMLMLLDDETEELYLCAAKGVGEETARSLHVRVADSTARRSLRSERPVHIRGDGIKVATGDLVKALLYVPLRVPGRGAIGVLGIVNRQTERPFAKRDTQLLLALADYAAIAIENAQLFRDVKAERTKLEMVLREANEPIIVVDETDKVLLCNTAARDTLGLHNREPPSSPVRFGELVSHPVLADLFAQRRRGNQVLHREITLDSNRVFNARLTPIEGVGRALVMQDITYLKELDRLKSEFVATVSHDLRTPLTNIQGFVELLPRVGPLNEQQQRYIQLVQESLSDIAQLIRDLLDIGRIEADLNIETEPCDLREVVDDVVVDLSTLAQEKDQKLRWQPVDELPLVQGNPQRLRQAVENLVGNAIKYTGKGGWITISVHDDDGCVVVNVADNGIGIPLEHQAQIFDRFYRVESEDTEGVEGTGLGLAIVKAVVEKHNGRVWVESEPNVGSVFSFVLPALDEQG